jgi:hypothetical protein
MIAEFGLEAAVFSTVKYKVQSEPGLISQDLRRQLSREAHFRSYSAPKAHQANFENCAKLLKPNRGEVAERLNAAVC